MTASQGDDRSYRPRWLRGAFFLRNPPPLTRRQWNVLGLVSLVSMFETYDVYLFSLNLSQIQRELGFAESDLGWLGSVVRAGALGAVLVTLLADRLGRRRILLFTVLGYTLLTGATALAPNASWFVAFQMGARVFAAAEGMLAVVVIAEEFDAEHRGWGIGALAAITACGGGLAALAFAFVDVLPFGWRSLYAVGLVPLLALAWWRRAMPETERFLELERTRSVRATPTLAPFAALARGYPRRFLALAAAAFLLALFASPAIFFAPKYLQDVHGWSPAWVAGLNFVGGAFAIVANPIAGRMSDVRGRRPVTIAFLLAASGLALAFYAGPAFAVGPLWAAMMFGVMGAEVTLAAYGAEMFPTSYRSTASGVRAFVTTLGTVGGLASVALLFGAAGSNWQAIEWLGAVALLAPILVWLAFPETSGRALEEIAPEEPQAPESSG